MQAWRPFKTWEAEGTAPWIISIVPGLAQVDTWIFWETPLSLTAPVSGRPPQLLLNAQVLLVPHSPLCSKTANWQLRTIYFHSTSHSRSWVWERTQRKKSRALFPHWTLWKKRSFPCPGRSGWGKEFLAQKSRTRKKRNLSCTHFLSRSTLSPARHIM